MVYNRPEPGL